jgi:hypothetical protein
VASVLDASGSPLAGHSLSCWIRSTCGLVQDVVPGWAESYSWYTIAEKLNAGQGMRSSPSPLLFLPGFCSDAGYPPYVRGSQLFLSIHIYILLASECIIREFFRAGL